MYLYTNTLLAFSVRALTEGQGYFLIFYGINIELYKFKHHKNRHFSEDVDLALVR